MLTLQQVAEMADLNPETVRHYHKMATRARSNNTTTARSLPAPVAKLGQQNLWDTQEIHDWIANRKAPKRMGAIPKKEMREVLRAALAGNLDQVITIAKRNI